MAVTGESVSNFQRAAVGDSLLVVYGTLTRDTHLSLAERRDGAAVPNARRSFIGGAVRAVLPAAGGHAQIANWAGIQAQQVGVGNAAGNAAGCSIQKTGDRAWQFDTLRSGFNRQYAIATNPRPAGTAQADMERTLPAAAVEVIRAQIDAAMGDIMDTTDPDAMDLS